MDTNNLVNNNVNNINIVLGGTAGVQQLPWIVRAVYYLVIGWWLAAFWVSLAYLLALLIVTLPLAAKMFNTTNKVLTLAR